MTGLSQKYTAAAPTLSLVTLFPKFVQTALDTSMLGRAQKKGLVNLRALDLRSFATDVHRTVDDAPFGGEQGMLLKADVLAHAAKSELDAAGSDRAKIKFVYTHPRGSILSQPLLEGLKDWLLGVPERRLCVVCGRYEGVDERFVQEWVDLEVSAGDFILTGGELPALMLVDGVVRLIPNVLGHAKSASEESFSSGLLEHPQYTRPREHKGLRVPEELLSGHHLKVQEWKLRESLLWTMAFRPDLLRAHSGEGLPKWARELLAKLKARLDVRDL